MSRALVSTGSPRISVHSCAYVRLSMPIVIESQDNQEVENIMEKWCCQRGLNSRPLPYQGNTVSSEFNRLSSQPGEFHGFFTTRRVRFAFRSPHMGGM